MITLAATNTIRGVAGTATAITYTIMGAEKASNVIVYKPLAQGQLPASVGTLYTAPASTEALVKTITLVNATESEVTGVILYINGTAASNRITGSITIAAGYTFVLSDDGWKMIDTDGAIVQSGGSSASGDMLKAVYDTDLDNRVDVAEGINDGTYTATAANISDAVSKKHSQNTDTGTSNSIFTINGSVAITEGDVRLSDARVPLNHYQSGETINAGTIDGNRLPAMSTSKQGAVPAVGSNTGYYLKGDGGFGDLASKIHDHDAGDITTGIFDGDLLPDMSTTKLGGVPAIGSSTGYFLRGDGWSNVNAIRFNAFAPPSGQISMANERITNVAEPVLTTDAATKNYSDKNAAFGLSTTILTGFRLKVNTDTTKFDIYKGTDSANIAVFVDSTNPLDPTITQLQMDDQLGIADDHISEGSITYIAVDKDGVIHQSATFWDDGIQRDWVFVGSTVHSNRVTINAISEYQTFAVAGWSQFDDWCVTFGRFNKEGNIFGPHVGYSDVHINKSLGKTWAVNVNYKTDKKNPNLVTDAEKIGSYFLYTYTDGDGVWSAGTAAYHVNPELYDTLYGTAAVDAGNWTIQCIIWVCDFQIAYIQYGQVQYASKEDAIAHLHDSFIVNPNLSRGVPRCLLVVQQGATDLNDTNTAVFFPLGRFGLDTISGSGSAGESNTMANIGEEGVGVFYDKVGVEFDMKNIAPASSMVTVSDDVPNKCVDIGIVPGNIDHQSLSNIGTVLHTDIDAYISGGKIAGIYAGGNTSGTMGTITAGSFCFAGGNNITLSQSSGANSSIISIIGAVGGGGGVALSAGSQLATSGTIAFVNSYNITFGMSDSTQVTASASFNQSAQTFLGGISASNTLFTSGTVTITGSNIVTVKSAAGQIIIDASVSNTIPPIATTVYDVATAGSIGTVTRFAAEEHRHRGVGQFQISGNTSNTSNVIYGSVVIAGGNNITLSQVSGVGIATITISAHNQSVQSAVAQLNGSSASLTLVAGNMFSVSNNANTISMINLLSTATTIRPVATANSSGSQSSYFALADHAHAGIVVGGVSGGNTSNTSGTYYGSLMFAGGNNITLSAATAAGGQTITISAGAAGAGAIAAVMNSATTYTSGTIYLSEQANITINTSVDGVSQYFRFSAPAGGAGGGATLSEFQPIENGITSLNTIPQGSLSIRQVFIPFNVVASQIRFAMSQSVATFTSATTATCNLSVIAGIYTLNGSTLSLASSGSRSWQFTYRTNSSASAAGMKELTIPMAINATPGAYWIGLVMTTATTYSSRVATLFGDANLPTAAGGLNFSPIGSGTGTYRPGVKFQGVYTAATSQMPASIGTAAINFTSASNPQRANFWFEMKNIEFYSP